MATGIATGTAVASELLERLHSKSIQSRVAISELLEKLRESHTWMSGRRTVRGDAEAARIVSVRDDTMTLEHKFLAAKPGDTLLLNFVDRESKYFFTATVVIVSDDKHLEARTPAVIYVAERRDRPRSRVQIESGDTDRIEFVDEETGLTAPGLVVDQSAVGIAVEAEAGPWRVGSEFKVRFVDGRRSGEIRWGLVRRIEASPQRTGWQRLGLSISEARGWKKLDVERRSALASPVQRVRLSVAMVSAGATAASSRLIGRLGARRLASSDIEVVDFKNSSGEPIRGLVNRFGHGGTAVIIPPAWGRTKETLLPLAMTLLATFQKANEPIAVLRFDGTRRRGESFRAPGYEADGAEHLPFRLRHAVDDIAAAAHFVVSDPAIRASRVILVSFSAASIEARRAICSDSRKLFDGWVSVVGTPDLQSGLRAVSGGLDFVGGVDRGLRFGVQEIMGVPTDIDGLISDALDQRLAFLEDARRDLSGISVPVTWIHGSNDAWLDLDRVRTVMGSGCSEKRRLVEIPTGHQLRSSREAIEVFQFVSQEVGFMATGRSLSPAPPDLSLLSAMRNAERERLPRPVEDVQAFWRSYLVGREGALGIELMNATDAYRELMDAQIDGLALQPGDRIADVGCGTGALPLALVRRQYGRVPLHVLEIDYVAEALERAKERLDRHQLGHLSLDYHQCDIESPAQLSELMSAGRFDAVLLSLVLSYVRNPEDVLAASFRGLAVGGRLVASTLRRDADISALYLSGVDQLRAGRAREVFGDGAELLVDRSVRSFLNDMARVLDLEERGIFSFLDADEMVRLIEAGGFSVDHVHTCFGDPPQAVVVCAVKSGPRG